MPGRGAGRRGAAVPFEQPAQAAPQGALHGGRGDPDGLAGLGERAVVGERAQAPPGVGARAPHPGGGQPGPHPLQGIGAGFIPKILDTKLLDGTITVSKDESFVYTLRTAKEEGILVGISTGAALAAVAKKLGEDSSLKKVLTFNYDTGERYLSVDGLFPAV